MGGGGFQRFCVTNVPPVKNRGDPVVKQRTERNVLFPSKEFRDRVRSPQRSEAFAPNTFILTACENELKRGDSTEATAKLEARIAATLANVTKEVQLLFTSTRRLPSQILYCSTF